MPRGRGVQVGTIFGEGTPPKIWEGKIMSKIQRDFCIRVINFELLQPICPAAYINVTDRQIDRQTDGRTDDLR